jgi:hypothetical protein
MAKKTIAAAAANGKEGVRSKLNEHEIALLAELYGDVQDGAITIREMASRFG